jgi:hypothetical protein
MDEFTGRRPAKPYGRLSGDAGRAFLLALRLTGRVRLAAEEIGRSIAAAYARRKRFRHGRGQQQPGQDDAFEHLSRAVPSPPLCRNTKESKFNKT